MVALDEVDELFIQEENAEFFIKLREKFEENKTQPQYCCYSATYPDNILEKANLFVGDYKHYPVKKECLRLAGV
jgi:superfamily II DNA/RNA helicase